MRRFATMIAMAAATALAAGGALAQDLTVGVSWSNFQEERWKTDEAAIKAALSMPRGAKYISADAQSSSEQAIGRRIESLIARGATALIILAQDADAVAGGRRRRRTKAFR